MASDDELPILYAIDAAGSYQFIEDVPNGDACDCFCPACGQPMRARNAGVKRRHSFAHQPGATCSWAVEAVITALAKQAVEETGCIALPSLFYHNSVTHKDELLSKARRLRVVDVEERSVSGRQAPCLIISVRGGNDMARFALCVSLRKKITLEQANELCEETRGVVLVDLGIDLKRQRKELGKHYDRDELIKGYQDKQFLAGVLLDSDSGLSSWLLNARRDAEEERSREERLELDRQEEQARREHEKELERQAEKRRKELEAQAERRKREESERAEREAREGIVKEPDRYVTAMDEYDVRLWHPEGIGLGVQLAQNERFVRNGELLALIVQNGDKSVLRIQADMTTDAIDEVSWNLEELTEGFDEFVLVLSAVKMGDRVHIIEPDDGPGTTGTLCFRVDARAYCCALQGLLRRGAAVIVNMPGRQSWKVERVSVNDGQVAVRKRG